MLKYFKQLYQQDPHYYNHIEGLRAMAAIWIMLYHIAIFATLFVEKAQYLEMLKHPFFKITLSSSVSLDVFFVITGLVVGHTLMKKYQSTGKADIYRFFVRRFARVYPLYVIIIILTIPFTYRTLPNAWTNMLQINNFLPITEQHLVWTWSLAIDFQFYVLFSLIIWFVSKNIIGKKTCIFLALVFFLLPFVVTPILIHLQKAYHVNINSYIVVRHDEWKQLFRIGFDKIYVRCGPLLYGALTAYILLYHKEKLTTLLQQIHEHYVNALAILVLLGMWFLLANDPIWFVGKSQEVWQTSSFWAVAIQRNLFSFLLCVLLLLSAYPRGFMMHAVLKFLNFSLWRPFGQLAFSTYMIHPIVIVIGFFFIFAYHDITTAPEYFRYGLWLILISYLIAIPTYLFVEQPVMDRIKDKILNRKQSSSAISSPPNSTVFPGIK